MGNLFVWLAVCVGFLFFLGILMLINPKLIIDRKVFWNLIGRKNVPELQKQAEGMVRVCAGFLLFVCILIFSMGFEIFMMSFR